MIRKISYTLATNALLILTTAITLFHLLIIAKVIPYTIVWGGRLTNDAEMLRMESVSIAINLFILLIVAMKAGYIRQFIPAKVINIILWILVGLMLANTVANIFSATWFEAIVFTPLTLLYALFLYRILQPREMVQVA